MVLQRVWRGFVRFVLWPLFGYDPSRIQGEWLPSDAYSARWAVLGCCSRAALCAWNLPGDSVAHERSLAANKYRRS